MTSTIATLRRITLAQNAFWAREKLNHWPFEAHRYTGKTHGQSACLLPQLFRPRIFAMLAELQSTLLSIHLQV